MWNSSNTLEVSKSRILAFSPENHPYPRWNMWLVSPRNAEMSITTSQAATVQLFADRFSICLVYQPPTEFCPELGGVGREIS
ncbi:hypothetical protein FF1_034619 [Malus domestica]